MATITLKYDARNAQVQKTIDNLLTKGLVVFQPTPKAKNYCNRSHKPNAATIAAFKELDNGGGKKFKTTEALFADLYD
ncbi:hypothetical protein FACS1894178_9430 [Bacteroidia bacterium]|nr:hypothetical protein FACS1894178_9430 [Bacteroidia bacterium]